NFVVNVQLASAQGDTGALASAFSAEAVRQFNLGFRLAAEHLDRIAGALSQAADDIALIHNLEQARGRAQVLGTDEGRAVRNILAQQLAPAAQVIKDVQSFGFSIRKSAAAFAPAGGTAATRAIINAGRARISAAGSQLFQAIGAGAEPSQIL